MRIKVSIFHFLMFSFISSRICAGPTAEQVLGKYWEDPLFGDAAASQSATIEILNGAIWPTTVTLKSGENIRLLFKNKSPKSHLITLAEDMDQRVKDKAFQAFVEDTLAHAEQASTQSRYDHRHEGVDESAGKRMVRTLADKPSVWLPPNSTKELIVFFPEPIKLNFACVLNDKDLTRSHVSSENGVMYIE